MRDEKTKLPEAQPLLHGKQLTLRPFSLSDAPRVQLLAGAEAIAETTLNIPHPYLDGMAEAWIGNQPMSYLMGDSVTWAVCLRESGLLIGAIGIILRAQDSRGEMGYWIGHEFWGRGYCTEAAALLMDFFFRNINLNRIHATHFVNNPASGRVMQKLGMTQEGVLRHHARKNKEWVDLVFYGILREEWLAKPLPIPV